MYKIPSIEKMQKFSRWHNFFPKKNMIFGQIMRGHRWGGGVANPPPTYYSGTWPKTRIFWIFWAILEENSGCMWTQNNKKWKKTQFFVVYLCIEKFSKNTKNHVFWRKKWFFCKIAYVVKCINWKVIKITQKTKKRCAHFIEGRTDQNVEILFFLCRKNHQII